MRTAAYDLDDADAIKLLTGKGQAHEASLLRPLHHAADECGHGAYLPVLRAAYRQRGTRFSFVADLSGVSVKELMQSMEVTL